MNQSPIPKVSLEQWQAFQAVVTHGSFQAAADAQLKSQSTISYAVQKMQDTLNIRLFQQEGRRSVLTEAGKLILHRAQDLLEQACALESAAQSYAQGWEPLVVVAVDMIFPQEVISQALQSFSKHSPNTRLEILSTSLSGTSDALTLDKADLSIGGSMPPTGYFSEKLLDISFSMVCHPDHELQTSTNVISEAQLKKHLQIVVRDSGAYRRIDAGWLKAEKRWTVSSFHESIELIKQGLGFAFIPTHLIQKELDNETLKTFTVESGTGSDSTHNANNDNEVKQLTPRHQIACYITHQDLQNIGPATKYLADSVRQASFKFQQKGYPYG